MPPTETEVLNHFGSKIPTYAKLMKVPYTTIWALTDGTLLWDKRNGFADLGEAPKVAKSAEVHKGSPHGQIAAQRETIARQSEDLEELRKELTLAKLELSMAKSRA